MAGNGYSRRAYKLRDEQRDFRGAKVEVIVLIDGEPHARMAIVDESLFSVVRKPEGLDVDLVSPGALVTDLPAEDPKQAAPEAWQLEALKTK